MKKGLLWIVAAVAAMVSCSEDDGPKYPEENGVICSSVKIVGNTSAENDDKDDDTGLDSNLPSLGVTIGGADYTQYSWEVGDKVAITSQYSLKSVETMTAMTSGTDNVKFSTDFSTYNIANEAFYAVYPYNETLSSGAAGVEGGGRFVVDVVAQDGTPQNSALLAAHAVGSIKNMHLQFYPVNSLLRVEVVGAPGALKQAVLRQKNNENFITQYVWDIVEAKCYKTGASGNAITIKNPSSEGFFISLPPDLALNDFVIELYTEDRLMKKEFSAMTFKRGYTYRARIDWCTSEPKVTCGARTSYDYYLEGDIERANYMVNNALVIGDLWIDGSGTFSDAHSTYEGINDDYIQRAGLLVNGIEYDMPFKDGIIGYNTEKGIKHPQLRWGSHAVTAYVVLKDGTRYTHTKLVHITGIPYKTNSKNDCYGFYSDDDVTKAHYYPWRNADNGEADVATIVRFKGHDGLTMEGVSRWPQVLSPAFHIPSDKGIDIYAYWAVSHSGWIATTVSLYLSDIYDNKHGLSSFLSKKLDSDDYSSDKSKVVTMTPTMQCVLLNHEYGAIGPVSTVHELRIKYGEK